MEIWKDIKGYEGKYQVSNLGNIRSLSYKGIKGRIGVMKPKLNKGYHTINLYYEKRKCKTYQVHRLVAGTFIPNIDNKREVDHINGIKTDNRIENLRWATPKENMNNPLTTSKIKKSKKKSKPVICIEENKIFKNISQASRHYGIHYVSILGCCNGEQKAAGGYTWMFAQENKFNIAS